VAVKIKLKRLGKIREPYYRIVVADARTKRDGRAIEEIGKYHPKADPSLIEVNSERVQHWLSVGAQPTDPVRALLKVTGDWQKFTGEPGAEGTLRTAAPREDRKERFAAAAKESAATKDSSARDAAKDSTAKDSTAKNDRTQGKAGARSGGRAKAKAENQGEDAPATQGAQGVEAADASQGS
jgi:small subunit ribosomal protein S16